MEPVQLSRSLAGRVTSGMKSGRERRVLKGDCARWKKARLCLEHLWGLISGTKPRMYTALCLHSYLTIQKRNVHNFHKIQLSISLLKKMIV